MEYNVISSRPYMYTDQLNQAINGFEVTFEIVQLREFYRVYVPRMDAALIKIEIEKLIAERKKLLPATK